MRRYLYLWSVALVALTVALSVGVATATAGGGNSANAKLCQKGGWMSLVRSDGTSFNNQDECVSYAAKGGALQPKPPCTAGSDNFSDDAGGSQPTTFAGGTIDGPYAFDGQIVIQGSNWLGGFPVGTHALFNGFSTNPFRLTFTQAVSSVQLDADADLITGAPITVNAYDASNALVDTDSATDPGGGFVSLSVTSTSNNIKYFTIETSDDNGVAFTNIVWACA